MTTETNAPGPGRSEAPFPHSTWLNGGRRRRELAALGDDPVVDLLVIGGGVTGVGVALDAASRGLTVVLAERRDLAFGTSRFSSKLVHGGLRYLAGGHLGIAHESAVERGILLRRTAPHLTRALPQLVPLLPEVSRASRLATRAGFLAGDGLRAAARTPASLLPRSRRVSAAAARALAPSLLADGLTGALLAYDGALVDDARLVVAIARTAAGYGARILTRTAASEVTGDGAKLTDSLTGETLRITARAVINAAGVWAGEVDPAIKLRPSRGSHLVFDACDFGNLTAALTVPIPGELARFVFAVPAPHGRVYLGLTDIEAPGPIPDEPATTPDEAEFLLEVINTALAQPLEIGHIRGSFAGLRPLLDTGGDCTADLSRKHAVIDSEGGVITVVGGKLTTYRRMAADAVDHAIATRGLTHATGCRTKDLPLVGAAAREELAAMGAPSILVRRFGTEAPGISAGDTRPLAEGLDVCRAEVTVAVTREGALDAADVLDRRTRLGLVPADRARAEPAVAELLDSGLTKTQRP